MQDNDKRLHLWIDGSLYSHENGEVYDRCVVQDGGNMNCFCCGEPFQPNDKVFIGAIFGFIYHNRCSVRTRLS